MTCSDKQVFTYRQETRHTVTSDSQMGVVDSRCTPLFRTFDTLLNRKIGPWTVYNYRLGHGTFGIVNLAVQTNSSLQVACKTSSIVDKTSYTALSTEIRLLKRAAGHHNLCSIYDVIEAQQQVHIFLPLVMGGDLFGYLEKHGRLSEDEVKFASMQMVSGLEYLHSESIAHRGEFSMLVADT